MGSQDPFPGPLGARKGRKVDRSKVCRVTTPRARLSELYNILRDGPVTSDGVGVRGPGKDRRRTKRFRATGPALRDSWHENEGG